MCSVVTIRPLQFFDTRLVLGTDSRIPDTRFNTRYPGTRCIPVTYPGIAKYPFVFLEIVKSVKL